MSKAAELANLIGNINAGGGGVNRNVIINGAMNVSQRSTSVTGLGNTADNYHTVDRFKLGCDTTAATAGRLTMTQDSSAPSGFANSLKLACTTADTSIAAGELCALFQPIEGQNLQAFAKGTSDAKPFAVSFYVKGNASATYMLELKDTDNTRVVHRRFAVTTDWNRIEVSFPADTTGALDDDNAKSLELRIWLHAGSNYTSGTYTADTWASQTQANRAVGISSFFDSTDRTFFITGVQLEVGQNPTEFEHEPYERTLAKCQRYFFIAHQDNAGMPTSSGYTFMGIGSYYSSSSVNVGVHFPVAMRAIPTSTVNFGSSGNQGFISYTNGAVDYIGTSGTLNMPSIYGAFISFNGGDGGAGNAAQIVTQYDDQSFSFSAEL